MATLEKIDGVAAFIRKNIESEHKSHKDVSDELQRQYPGLKGLSSRSIRRFCCKHGIHATSRLSSDALSRVVRSAVSQVIHLHFIIICIMYCLWLVQRMDARQLKD